MRIGLFGGSFNPVHDGHRLVVEETLRRLELDALWVLVTPGNPLKNHNELAPLADRVSAARRLLDHPRVRVTGFEAAHGFTYSWQTVRFLTEAMPDIRKISWLRTSWAWRVPTGLTEIEASWAAMGPGAPGATASE